MNVDSAGAFYNELVKLDLSATIINRYNQPDFINHAYDLTYANNSIYLIERYGSSSSSIHQFDTNGNYISSMSTPSFST